MKKISCLFIVFPLLMWGQKQTKGTFSEKVNLAVSIIKTSVKTIPTDFVYMGKNLTEDWKQTALYTGIIGGLIVLDKPITQFYQSEIETRIVYQLPDIAINKVKGQWLSGEDAYMSYAMSGVYLGALFSGSERGQYAAINGFKALGYSIVISHVFLKTLFGRQRPYPNLKDNVKEGTSTNNPFDFFNRRKLSTVLKGGQSATGMPSLHATAYFAMAKVFQMEYGNYWIPYGIATGVFLSNIKGHRHWVSDMVTGGILGTIIGRSIVRSSWKARGILKQDEISFKCIPTISSTYNGIQLTATF